MTDRIPGFATLAIHAGAQPDPTTGARATPIYQTTSFVFDDVDHAASLFGLQTFGNIYTRIGNPTNAVLEERVAALEGGTAGLAVASGHAAQVLVMHALMTPGDEFVASKKLYGGSINQFNHAFRNFGWNVVWADPDDLASFDRAISPKTKAIFVESIANPGGIITDMDAIGKVARRAGVPFIVDNTLASPYLCRPIEHGADIVVHSLTKYLGGHGTTMGGILVESGKFPWDNGNFPQMTEPSRGYHGVRFYETFGDFGFTMKARMETMRTLGPTLSPLSAFLLLQGIETLHVRMPRHCESTLAIAKHLSAHPRIAWVNYPLLSGNRYETLARKYLPSGASGILTFGVKGGAAAGVTFIESVQFLSHLANVGDAKTLVIHPASTTHRQLDENEQRAAGVLPEMIRLSVGLETLDDILWDIDQALATASR